jgi:RNA polymerase sigma factor (sigma-70 family)
MAWRALGDADWMEDAMQALYARLWQDRATRRIPPGLSAREALVRWTMNECRTLNRRRARTCQARAPFEAAANHPAPGQAPDEAADHRLIAEAVRRLLGTLPDPYREALIACELEGATHAEAGNILGLPARTVQTHVRRGRELLARKLRKAGITLPAGAALASMPPTRHASIKWVAASDIIANASSTVATAGAIAPSEGTAATSLFSRSRHYGHRRRVRVGGCCALVWVIGIAPQNPSSLDAILVHVRPQRPPSPQQSAARLLRPSPIHGPTPDDPRAIGHQTIHFGTVSATGVTDGIAMATIRLIASESEDGSESSTKTY